MTLPLQSSRSVTVRNTSRQSGFALFSALVSIVLLTALASSIIFRASADASMAYATTLQQHAFFSAERALNAALFSLNPTALDAQPLYHSIVTYDSSNGISSQVIATKTDTSSYWLVSRTTISKGVYSASHRLGFSVKLTRNSVDSSQRLIPIQQHAWIDLY